MHTQKWFLNRIWKRVYRDDTECKCEDCAEVAKNGLIIADKDEAYNLYVYHCESGINYRDIK